MTTYLKPERRTELCSVERYTLDLRKSGIPEEHFGTLLLPVCRGKYLKDFDILIDELSPEIRARVEDATLAYNKQLIARLGLKEVPENWHRRPIGFNATNLPSGAAIVRGVVS